LKTRLEGKKLDLAQLGKAIVDSATIEQPKSAAAVALGRLGGLKGGEARAAKLTAKQRKASARKAAKARWSKQPSRLKREQ